MKADVKNKVSTSLGANVDFFKKELGVGKSFDVIHLEVEYAGRKMALFMVDGLVKDDMLHLLLKFMANLKEDQLQDATIQQLMKSYLPYIELDSTDDLDKAVDMVLAGPTALVVEGASEVIIIDARTYPVRGPEEPDTERVVRGSRDGFVETIVFNTALIRRRVRDRTLRMEYIQAGRRSKTDMIICYIEDIADGELVDKLKDKLSNIDTDGLPMAEKTVEEFITGSQLNPFPAVRYTERPDTTAVHLYEGHVCVLVDGSPSVLITPTTYWHHLQHAEEYRNKPLVGAYLRIVRFFAVWASLFLLPLWYLLVIDPSLVPKSMKYIGPNDPGKIPLFLQFLIIEIGIDMLRMAAIHTPTSLATALGLIAALMIGQVAVEVGLLTNEVILYLALAAIGTFATPSYELSLANRLIRLFLLIVTALFHTFGLVVGFTLVIIYLARMKSFGVPYLWPFIPFDIKALRDVVFRSPIPLKNKRPRILDPQDPDR
ncbi:spore germination protein [Neobacillus piezotolerans]|uniref:Spore germination protein n=1 Tax=Neobacillus piezotolerans TaxID=2259171 RepID=A0A3D8GT85_9BACI|nr:spore germination protein [Neobacillus piezotolerans]RDU37658.1 spore germination protein [Neobacillus piezotolerans]